MRTPKPWVAATFLFWMLQAGGPAILGIVFLGKSRRAQALKDVKGNRIRRAYPAAKKSLRQMKRHMRKREDKQFYDGLAKIASDYLATRFEIPNAYIGMTGLPDYFEHYKVPLKLQQRWKAALTACEYVRYAAVVLPDKDMWVLFRDVKAAIHDFEKYWRQRNSRKNPAPSTAALLAGWLFLSGAAYAGEAEVHFWCGNTQAEKGEYAAAEGEYCKVLALKIEDADVFYNLGNTYLHQGKPGPAILAYKRAGRLTPREADLQYNLRQAEAWVEQKRRIPAGTTGESIIMQVYQSITPNEAAWVASFFYFVAVFLGILILLCPSKFKRWQPAVWILAGLVSSMAVWSGLRYFEPFWRKQAIVMTRQTEIYSRPYANAEVLYTIPEGTSVAVKREDEAWVEVYCQPEQRGWTKRSTLGFIE